MAKHTGRNSARAVSTEWKWMAVGLITLSIQLLFIGHAVLKSMPSQPATLDGLSKDNRVVSQKPGWQCHKEWEAEYDGEEVVRWGDGLYTTSSEECCAACNAYPRCNVWVWCSSPSGCGPGRQAHECWLKRKTDLNVLSPHGRRGAGLPWVSGAKFTELEFSTATRLQTERLAQQVAQLENLRTNESFPLTFFDVTIKGKPVGRIEFALFTDTSPRAAENFRRMCTGEMGVVPEGHEGAGKAYHFKGARFYRIIDQFIDQAGVDVDSTYGGMFKDDPGGIALKHDRKGLLSMANIGPDTNTAHFSIMMGPAPHLDGHYTIFGQVVSGFEVVDAINALSKGKPENTATADEEVVIQDCGQIRKGTLEPNLES